MYHIPEHKTVLLHDTYFIILNCYNQSTMQNKIHNPIHISSNKFSAKQIEHMQNWIELDTTAVEQNAQQFKQWLDCTTKIAAVIKSNAYGHGIVEMAKIYNENKTISALCVINLTEAITIREQACVTKPIFVIGYLDQNYDLIIKYDLQVIIYDFNIALELNEIGKKHQQKIQVHIKFDTGMHRLGVSAEELDFFIDSVQKLSWIKICGIFTHLAESYNLTRTTQQITVFEQAKKFNYQIHASNSHGALTTQTNNYNFARIGIGLFGYLQKGSQADQNKLRPILSLKTKILQIKSVSAGTAIGYDGMFQTPTDMIIATIAIGYHEGLDARLSNIGSVIINGQLAKIIGRICMNLTIVDITKIPDCSTGQIVTVLGKEGNTSISVYDWSALTKASVYNHLTKLSATIPKIVIP